MERKMTTVRRALDLDELAQAELITALTFVPPQFHNRYSDVQLQEFKNIAHNNNNFKLCRLKKVDQIKICIHHGISPIGTKEILENRIILYRDSIYVYREYCELEKIAIYMKYGIRHMYSVNNFTVSRFSFIMKKIRRSIKKDSKINLAIIYHKLVKINDPQTTQSIENAYRGSSSRDNLIQAINSILNELSIRRTRIEAEVEAEAERQRARELIRRQRRENMKRVQIQNLTGHTIYVYWTDKRAESPEFSICCKQLTLLSGLTSTQRFAKDTISIIISKSNIGFKCYYFDLTDHIISEKNVSETNGTFEIKEDKRELEQWKEAALKCDYLIKQLKRLGIDKNENYAMIVDMHQDIVIPQHSERDKEIAGIPSALTNVT